MTLQEFKAALLDAKEIIQDKARGLGRDVKAYCHWTGGDYNTDSDDYHICIRGDGTIINTLPLYMTPEATYHETRDLSQSHWTAAAVIRRGRMKTWSSETVRRPTRRSNVWRRSSQSSVM